MSQVRRCRVPLFLTLLLAVAVAWATSATAALATEGDEETTPAEDEDSGFGSGDWDGLLLAGGVGILFGVGVFAFSEPGSIPKADDHH